MSLIGLPEKDEENATYHLTTEVCANFANDNDFTLIKANPKCSLLSVCR